jgi:ABC-2 type transport system ATP-binding protein
MSLTNSPVITIKGLSKFYGKARGIDSVSMEIGDGEIFGFIGPNGAGKSTTIRILLNLIFPSGGSASIMGMDIIRETKMIKQNVGYVPADATAYPSMEVYEFLEYCMRFYRVQNGSSRIGDLASLFELDLKRKIADLSMGNRKKVSIIQSLLHSPKLLILDEPTMGLDPLMQARFFDLLRSENQKGMTIFFSSHTLSDIQLLCRRVAIIKEGKIIRVEEIDNLRKKQLKKVHIEFENQADKEELIKLGMEINKGRTDNSISFMYAGEINELIIMLAGRKMVDMTIEEPSLEEIFMHYYQ